MGFHRDPVWSEVARIWPVRERMAVNGKQALTPKGLDELPPFRSPVLVVGGGAGLIPLHLAKAGLEVTAVDACAEMVARARERASEAGLSVENLHVSGSEMDLPSGRFETALVSTGVVTQTTLEAPGIEDTLERVRQALAEEGRLLVAYVLETEANREYRELYRDLGLDRIPSNNRWFLETDSVDEVWERFREAPDLDRAAVEICFTRRRQLVEHQHRMLRAFEQELRRQGVEPVAFVGEFLGYEKPFLERTHELQLTEKIAARFRDLEGKLLSDDETCVISATR